MVEIRVVVAALGDIRVVVAALGAPRGKDERSWLACKGGGMAGRRASAKWVEVKRGGHRQNGSR